MTQNIYAYTHLYIYIYTHTYVYMLNLVFSVQILLSSFLRPSSSKTLPLVTVLQRVNTY